MKNQILLFVTALILIPEISPARSWTSSDGKKLEAELVKSDGQSVTIKREVDGQVFTLPLTKFSKEDQEFVAAEIEKRKMAEAEKNAPELALGEYEKLITGEFVKSEHKGVPYQMFGPKEVQKTMKLPLVLYLHGAGEKGDDNEQQIAVQGPKTLTAEANFSKRPCLVIAPQAANGWTGGEGDAVLDLIEDVLKQVSITDEDRVYITGYSMGGYGTWSMLGKEPDLFAAAVPIAGGGNPGIARDLKEVPIWNFHGDQDETVSVQGSRDMVEALEKARAPIKYTEMKGEGHGIPGKVYQMEEVHVWLFAQKRE